MTIDELEQFKRLVVDPVVDAVKTEMSSHVTQVEATLKNAASILKDHETRLGGLEQSQKRALVGWGVFAVGLSAAGTTFWNYLKSKFSIGNH